MTRSSLKSLIFALVLAAGAAPALAQGTAFTYQGELQSSGSPVNSPADFQFSLFTAVSGGTQVGSTVTRSGVSVTSGLFTTPVDFGVNPYTSNQSLFLQIAVRNPAGSGSFVTLGSRQPLAPTPFSLATRGLNVDASGNLTLTRDTNRTLSVAMEPAAVPGGSNGRSLTLLAGSAATTGGSFASLGGNLILQAGSAFNATQPNVPGGDTIIRSGANALSAADGLNGGSVILQTGSLSNTFVERMRITPAGNVGIGGTAPLAKFEVSDGIGSDPQRLGTVQITRPDNITGSHMAFIRSGFNAIGMGYRAQGSNVFGFGDAFSTTAFTPNRLAIDTVTGNVGIGTTTPQLPLHVRAPQVTTAAVLQVDTCGAPCGGQNYTEALRLINIGVAGGLPNGAGQVGLGMSSAATATATSTADVWVGTGFPTDAGNGTNDFIIATKTGATALTNRLRVNGDNGNVGIGTDAPAARLHNVGTTRIDDALQFGVQNFTGAAGSNARFYRFGAGGNGSNLYLDMTSTTGSSFILQANGNDRFLFDIGTGGAFKPGGGAWGVLSDERTKNDIQPMTGTLDRLLQLKGHAYTYKPEFVENGRALPGMQIGLVAQEVETVFPDWVTTGSDGLKQVTERSTTALMVEALRDLRTEKDAEIDALKARLEKLEAMLMAQAAHAVK